MTETIHDFKLAREALDERVKANGVGAMRVAFSAFFDSHPDIYAFRWTQYTPYFNDGDTCKFGVYDLEYKLGGKPQNWKSDTDFAKDWSFCSTNGNDQGPYDSEVEDFWEALTDDSIFKTIFGDHVIILVTRDGFTVAEYQHD